MNQKGGRGIGITLLQTHLLRADRVIGFVTWICHPPPLLPPRQRPLARKVEQQHGVRQRLVQDRRLNVGCQRREVQHPADVTVVDVLGLGDGGDVGHLADLDLAQPPVPACGVPMATRPSGPCWRYWAPPAGNWLRRASPRKTSTPENCLGASSHRSRVEQHQGVVQFPVFSPGFLFAAGHVQHQVEQLPAHVFDAGFAVGDAPGVHVHQVMPVGIPAPRDRSFWPIMTDDSGLS